MTDTDIEIRIKAESAKASKDIAKLTKQLNTMNKTIATGSKASVGQVGQMTRSFSSLTAHVSKLALIYGGFHALVSGGVKTAQFEQSIKKLGVYSGATAEQLAELEQKALALGESTVFSASQVAGGMNEMALAGLSSQEQLDGIEDILNLASVGMISLAEASNIAVVSMKSFGLEASDINDITDVIAKGSTISATTITELGQALAKVGTVAKAYNISLEETVGALGVLADAGRRGSEAGNQLKITMSRLAGNREAKKWMDELGISMYDTNTKALLPFNEQLSIVKTRLEKLPPSLKAIELSKIFGEEAKSSAIALMVSMDDLLAKTSELRKAMGDDFASKSAKKMMDTLQGSYKSLMSALEGLILEIGQNLSPIMRDSMDGITEMIRSMDKKEVEAFSNAIGAFIETLMTMLTTVTSVAGGIAGFASEHQNLMKAIALVVVGVKTFQIGLGVMASATLGGTTKLAGMLSMLKKINVFFMTNPWAMAILAIASAYVVVTDNLEEAEKARKRSVEATKEESLATGHLTQRVMTYFDKTLNGYYMTQAQREKELKSLGDQIGKVQALIDLGQAEDETDKNWLARKKSMETSLEVLLVATDKVINAKDADIQKTKLQQKAWEDFNELPPEIAKNIDKLTKAYEKLSANASIALDKLKSKESALIADIQKIALERVNIDRTYYNNKLDLDDEYVAKFKILNKSQTLLVKTEMQKRESALKNSLGLMARAESELHTGNYEQAKKYYDQVESLSDGLVIGALDANGKILYSQKLVDAEKLRITSEVYLAKKKMIDAEYIAEKNANIAKMEMKLLELELIKSQIKVQDEYMKKLITYTNYMNDNKITFDDETTKESFKTIDKMTNALKTSLSSLKADVQTRTAQAKVRDLDRQIAEAGGDVIVGANTASFQTEVRMVANKFVRVPINLPIGADPKTFFKDVDKAKVVITEKPIVTTLRSDAKPALDDVDEYVKDTKKKKPETTPMFVDMNYAYIAMMDFLKWARAKDQQPSIVVHANTERAVIEVGNFIQWASNQVIRIPIVTYNGGGYVPSSGYATGGLVAPLQHLAEGGTFEGSGSVAGYDSTDSDKVSAKLTGGEFVIKRQAVDSVGLSLLHSINNMTLDKPRGYATGGQVSGGSNSSSTAGLQPVNLNFGGKSFGVMADSDIVDAVIRHIDLTGGM